MNTIVSKTAAVKRVNRRLPREGKRLCVSRRGGECANLGSYHVVDVRTNPVTASHVDLEDIARELGVLATNEKVADVTKPTEGTTDEKIDTCPAPHPEWGTDDECLSAPTPKDGDAGDLPQHAPDFEGEVEGDGDGYASVGVVCQYCGRPGAVGGQVEW